MTTTTIARGSQFSENSIYDPSSWGSECTEAEAKKLGDALIAKFDEIANDRYATDEHTESISLIAGTSEVYGQFDGNYPDDMDLDEVMRASHEWVLAHMATIIDAQ